MAMIGDSDDHRGKLNPLSPPLFPHPPIIIPTVGVFRNAVMLKLLMPPRQLQIAHGCAPEHSFF